MEFGTHFNSKLLLFGEYGLMFDAMALSVPFRGFSGFLDFGQDHRHRESNAEIRKFYEYLKAGDSARRLHFQFDLDHLKTDLQRGLYFNSSVPQQYGVGSSGALVAALFSRYAATSVEEPALVPELLKSDFALLESYFHGRSSGLDPLISFLNRPLLLGSDKKVEAVDFELNRSGLAVALIDTHTTGATAPLVQHFIGLFNSGEFEPIFKSGFIPANNGCIESLLKGDRPEFFGYLEQLVRFQLQYFRRMIAADFHVVISDALNEKVFVKLLGSGGGGFLLVFAESGDLMKKWAEKRGLGLLKVV